MFEADLNKYIINERSIIKLSLPLNERSRKATTCISLESWKCLGGLILSAEGPSMVLRTHLSNIFVGIPLAFYNIIKSRKSIILVFMYT